MGQIKELIRVIRKYEHLEPIVDLRYALEVHHNDPDVEQKIEYLIPIVNRLMVEKDKINLIGIMADVSVVNSHVFVQDHYVGKIGHDHEAVYTDRTDKEWNFLEYYYQVICDHKTIRLMHIDLVRMFYQLDMIGILERIRDSV